MIEPPKKSPILHYFLFSSLKTSFSKIKIVLEMALPYHLPFKDKNKSWKSGNTVVDA